MKKIAFTFLVVLFYSTIASCKKSPCNGTCQNGSSCNANKCECTAGYRGENCEILIKNDLIGAIYVGNCNGSCGSSSTEFCTDSVQFIDNLTGDTKFFIVINTSSGIHKILANTVRYNSSTNEVSFQIPEQPFGANTVKSVGEGTYSLTNNILKFDLNGYCAYFTLLRQ